MEREFTRDSLVSEFILPSILGSQPLEPQITADSVCPSIDCPRYQTCTEPEGQLIAVAFCDSICVIDYCRNDAICTHTSINVAPRCFCAGKGLKMLWQPVGHESNIKSAIHSKIILEFFEQCALMFFCLKLENYFSSPKLRQRQYMVFRGAVSIPSRWLGTLPHPDKHNFPHNSSARSNHLVNVSSLSPKTREPGHLQTARFNNSCSF